MIQPTKESVKSELLGLLAETNDDRSRACPFIGSEVSYLVSRLQFWGASVYEPRGLSDTGLTTEELATVAAYRLPPYALDALYDYFATKLDRVLGDTSEP